MPQFSLETFLPEAAEILRVPVDQLTLESDDSNVSSWDSLSAVMLAMMVESNYGVALSSAQTEQFTSVRKIVDIMTGFEKA
ncbi:acyl carrier protein [Lacibacterium aquatile]|uniref:Acyl carrier protein n=1 Tax=Lacibacterium aquatile TaxID=1168082 RepID=A0ABW5DUQ4_9PROT